MLECGNLTTAAFSILLFTETEQPSGFFLSGVPGERSLLAGVEEKATLHDTAISICESKTL
jgi:hypothetical protein